MARSSSPRRAPAGEKLRGELVDWRNWKEGWGFGSLLTKHDGGKQKITGTLLMPKLGATLELTGSFVTGKYGPEFKFTGAEELVPEDANGVVAWLASTLPQISRERATKIVGQLGIEGTWRVLDGRDANELCKFDGITLARANEIFDAYDAAKGDRDRMVALKSYGLTDNQIARIQVAWGDKALENLRDNPYALIEMVSGFGWTRADVVALKMGLPKDAEPRLRAGLMHKLGEAQFEGHCYCPGGKLVKTVADAKMCGVREESVRDVLEDMVRKGELVRRGTGVFLPGLAGKEQALAESFAARVKAQKARAA
jgi:exodeoxyribonuclease V alpha subunit